MGMKKIINSQWSKDCRSLYGQWTMDYGLFLICFLICATGFSQDFKKQFKQAKELFADEKYSAAMDAFRPLTIYDKANPYPEYASFYYALSAQKLSFNTGAKEMCLQTENIYPESDRL